jgi:polysaccharide chain length determinant protein (PEP-CTERM system associated)
MAKEDTTSEIQRLIEIGWRRKWTILGPFALIFVVVNLWALYQPNLYRSSSSIFIEPQRVPSEYVRSTVTTDIEGRMRSISQQLTSRTKLLKVIRKLDLYPKDVQKEVPVEVLVANMRDDLSVESPNQRDANFFMVHFVHEDPTKAMLAVSNLVSLFVVESLQIRELQAEGTTEFIEEELEKLKMTLEKQEQAVQEYKAMYMGELPNQLEANLRILDNLQLQITSNQESQRELEGRLMLIEQEISRLEGNVNVASTTVTDGGGSTLTSATLNQLVTKRDALHTRINNMESMYTSRHPDLVAARRELEQVEGTLRAAQKELSKARPSKGAVLVNQAPSYSMEVINLRRQVTEIKPRLSSMRQEEKNLHSQLNLYQKRVEVSPLREQQLTQLTRDYENTKASYEELLTNKTAAKMSENLEKRQQGEKFQILDPANFPEKPYLPNRPKLMLIGFAGGLGGGIGLVILLEALFPVFFSLKQLQQYVTDIPITFGIPHIRSPLEKRRRQVQAAIALLTAVFITVSVLFLIDRYVIDLVSFFGTISSNARGML